MQDLYTSHLLLRVAAPAAMFVISALAACSSLAQDTGGQIELTILDAATGNQTPARIVVTDAKGGFHVAKDAILVETRRGDLESPVGHLSLEEAQAELTRRVFNPYNETDHWYSTGRSTMSLTPGVYRLSAWKGPEYVAETRDVVVAAGEVTELSVPMHRWIDMAADGWYFADAGAVYFSIKGQPGRADHPRAKALARQWLKKLETLEQQLTDKSIEKLAQWPSFADGVELDILLRDRLALLQAIEAAKKYFTQQAEDLSPDDASPRRSLDVENQ